MRKITYFIILSFNMTVSFGQEIVANINGKQVIVNNDASTNTKGIINLAGDLTGTAASPMVKDGAITSSKIATNVFGIARFYNNQNQAISIIKVNLNTEDVNSFANTGIVENNAGTITIKGPGFFEFIGSCGGASHVANGTDSRVDFGFVDVTNVNSKVKFGSAGSVIAATASNSNANTLGPAIGLIRIEEGVTRKIELNILSAYGVTHFSDKVDFPDQIYGAAYVIVKKIQ
jgi:hypothetical protein